MHDADENWSRAEGAGLVPASKLVTRGGNHGGAPRTTARARSRQHGRAGEQWRAAGHELPPILPHALRQPGAAVVSRSCGTGARGGAGAGWGRAGGGGSPGAAS